MKRSPLTGIEEDLRRQRTFVSKRAPVYAGTLDRLIEALATSDDFRLRLEEAWRAREFGAWYERPLLLLASLRDDVLAEGPAHPLWASIGAGDARQPGETEQSVPREALLESLSPARRRLWRNLEQRFVQTNEVSRAVAWLWPAAIRHRAGDTRPLAIVDIGASAGLNLVADAIDPFWTDGEGAPLATAPLPPLVSRTGYDLRPLDAGNPDDARWLLACVWPGQQDRESALRAAIAAYHANLDSTNRVTMVAAGAEAVPERLPRGSGQLAVIAYQTVMRDYLPPAVREAYEDGMRRWLERSEPGAAFWVELEMSDRTEGAASPLPATITVTVGSGAGTIDRLVIGHCEPHPRRVEIASQQVQQLVSMVRR